MDSGVADREAMDRIRRIRREIERAENEGDADAFGAHLAEDVKMLPADGPRRAGHDEVLAFHRDHFASFDVDVTSIIDNITVLGGLAVEAGTYAATLDPTDGGESREVGGPYLYVYERTETAGWSVIRMSW